MGENSSTTFWRALTALAVVTTLGLGACGGSDGDDASPDTTAAQDTSGATPSESGGDTDESSGGQEPTDADVPDPVALLPLEARVPDGFRQGAANCDPGYPNDPNRGEEPDFEGGADRYSSWFTYAVPEEWGSAGRGSAGSGGITGTDEDRRFDWDAENSSRGTIEVAVDWDSRSPDGEVLDWEGEPWTTFDYKSSVGDDEATITFEKVATVTVGDQEADLFYLDPAQAPNHVSQTEYRVRLGVLELPRNQGLGEFPLVPYSVVVTISFDASETPVDQATVEKIVESFTLPECTWEATLLAHEMIVGVDLNGDGHVRSAEDLQAELEEQLAEMQESSEAGDS